MTEINNLPAYALNHPYIVARDVDGEYWFWGAYDTCEEAGRAAYEVDGDVIWRFHDAA